MPSLVEIDPVVLEKIFKFLQCIFTTLYLSPPGKGVALHLSKLQSPSLMNAFCQVWLKLAEEDEIVISLWTDGR